MYIVGQATITTIWHSKLSAADLKRSYAYQFDRFLCSKNFFTTCFRKRLYRILAGRTSMIFYSKHINDANDVKEGHEMKKRKIMLSNRH